MQHLDEGTIHAWLDGELLPEDTARAQAHVSECSECRALVAEARGLIAASTRILTALDDIPSGVIPIEAPSAPVARPRRWYDRTDYRAAAALLFVAGASLVVVKFSNPGVSSRVAATTERATPMVSPLAGVPRPESAATTHEEKAEAANVQGGRVNESPSATTPAPITPRRSAVLKGAAPQDAGSSAAARRLDEASTSDAASKAPALATAVTNAPRPAAKSADSTAIMQARVAGVARAESASRRIEGRVTDQLGKGVAGASVLVQGTTLGATTDSAGRFAIENVPAGEQRVIVRRIGYVQQIVPVSMNDRVATANATVTPNVAQLSGVIVTGIATAPAPRKTGNTAAAKLEAVPLREVSVDSSGNVRRSTYEVSQGVQVTLVESSIEPARERAVAAPSPEARRAAGATGGGATAGGVAAAALSPVTNTISWVDRNRRYTLTGPLPPKELEAIKLRLMKMRE